ncbi:MAG: FAD-dependent thymidylate synthase, partial [bacterium]
MEKKLFLEDNIGFVELIDVFGSDLTVVNAARVSFNKESEFEPTSEAINSTEHTNSSSNMPGQKLSERDAKLIQYLAKHKHITPFFHPIIRMRIKMPIFVVREWYRHSIGFARNEVSRRYVTDSPEFFVPQDLRQRDVNIKQGSSDAIVLDNKIKVQEMHIFCTHVLDYYNRLLEQGVCPEQARMILPQSMYTEFI